MELSEFERYFQLLVQRTCFTPLHKEIKPLDIIARDRSGDVRELTDDGPSAAAGEASEKGNDELDNK